MRPETICYIFLCMLFSSGISFAQVSEKSDAENISIADIFDNNKISEFNSFNIGINDSVFFNLASAYQLASTIDIPVFVRSTSTIYSLDFEMRFDDQRVLLDTLLVLNSNLQYLYHYNVQDSTFRFTSNSLVPIDNDSLQLIMRFELLSSPMCSNDIQQLNTLLNGDACSNFVSNCVISATPELAVENYLKVFPNPASDMLQIHSESNGVFQLYDSAGNTIERSVNLDAGNTAIVDATMLPQGIYFYRFQNENSSFAGKVIISR